MVDFHTHILPGIDDGSRDVETTRQMLAEERRQGVELIVATPHFYANRMSVEADQRGQLSFPGEGADAAGQRAEEKLLPPVSAGA